MALLGFVLIILISFPFAKNALKQKRINSEIDGLKKEIATLQNKNVDLKKFVSYLESDQFAEEQARLNLGMKKSGEDVIVIKRAAENDISASSSPGTIFNIHGHEKSKPQAQISNPKKWLRYFFK